MSGSTGKSFSTRPNHLREQGRMFSSQTEVTGDESLDDEEWDNVETRSISRKDEPTKPLTVIFYVVALYLVFQIQTRSDDREILSHLPPTSSILSTNIFTSPHADVSHNPYHPYNVPHFSPLPRPPSPSSDSTWSYITAGLKMIVYPFYLLGAIAAVPLPLIWRVISSAVSLGVSVTLVVLHVIMYPATSTIDLLLSTFVFGPIKVIGAGLSVFKPMLSFLGTVIGVGGLMGLTVGWIGKRFLNWLLGNPSRAKKSRKSRSRNGKRSNRSSRKSSREPDVQAEGLDSGELTPKTQIYDDVEDIILQDDDALAGFEEAWQGSYRGTARQPPVLGTRRRTRPFEEQ